MNTPCECGSVTGEDVNGGCGGWWLLMVLLLKYYVVFTCWMAIWRLRRRRHSPVPLPNAEAGMFSAFAFMACFWWWQRPETFTTGEHIRITEQKKNRETMGYKIYRVVFRTFLNTIYSFLCCQILPIFCIFTKVCKLYKWSKFSSPPCTKLGKRSL